jgi:acetyl esterase/lipase
VHGDRDTLTPLSGPETYCEQLRGFGVHSDLHVYKGVGHLLTRNLANQESDFDPDPVAVADGIDQLDALLGDLGYTTAADTGPAADSR